MLKLFKKANRLNNKYGLFNKQRVIKELKMEYGNIPSDILEWFFVRHAYVGDKIMKGIINIDAHNIIVSKIAVTNDILLNNDIIDFAPFANYEEPYEVREDGLKNWYKEDYFKHGTWDYPIITIRQEGKLLVIDGTNRFRHMIICLKSKFDFIKNEHCVYVLSDKEH